jgi:hypothetical protein
MNQSGPAPAPTGDFADRMLAHHMGVPLPSQHVCGSECCHPWHVEYCVTPTPIRHPLDTVNFNWVLEGDGDAKVRLAGPTDQLPDDIAGAYRQMAEMAMLAGVEPPTSPVMVRLTYYATRP